MKLSDPSANRLTGFQNTDLINSRYDGGKRQELFLQLLLGEVRDTDALDLSGREQIFHLLPGIFDFPVEQDVTAGTVGKHGEIRVVSVWVEGDLNGERDCGPSGRETDL